MTIVNRDEELLSVKYEDKVTPHRFVQVGTLYVYGTDGDNASAHTQYQQTLNTTEQVYQRKCKVGEDWQELDLGWLKSDGAASIVHITNDEGRFRTIPTVEELEESEQKVLELAFEGSEDCWLIRPLASFPGEPSSMTKLRIRCRKGEGRYSIFVVPS